MGLVIRDKFIKYSTSFGTALAISISFFGMAVCCLLCANTRVNYENYFLSSPLATHQFLTFSGPIPFFKILDLSHLFVSNWDYSGKLVVYE